MNQPDLMKKTVLLAVFLFINFQIAIGQAEYEVVRGIYLKANPDTYADDLMLIPAGKIVKKDVTIFKTLPYPTYQTDENMT
ncbi:MAG: hypothetical protein K9I02_00910 [Haliscomenobacter sp.]|nr:hypothetical protein [Haliscomenobacter sp.]